MSKIFLMRHPILQLLFVAGFSLPVLAQQKVGDNPTSIQPSAAMELESTTKGFLPPRLTTLEREAIANPAQGLVIFNSTVNCVQWFNGTYWYDGCDKTIALPSNPALTCLPITTEVVDILSPTTGKTWMDRNLGAWRAATSSTDVYGYGDLYQFGRRTDGHQCRSSDTVSFQSSTPQVPAPNTAKLLRITNWYIGVSPLARDLWQEDGLGVNDVVCPTGYRLPLKAEWDAEIAGWGSNKPVDAFNTLKLPLAGRRSGSSGNLLNLGTFGHYSSGTAFSGHQCLRFDATTIGYDNQNFNVANSVRCIKN